MLNPQLFIGGAVAVLCGAAFRYDRWFLEETTKGRRLVKWLGEAHAVWVWRFTLAVGIAFGVALASGIVNPVAWE